jgi:CRISPR-associated endonuclease/helicase Cas3
MDEVQLMGPGRTTSVQLQHFWDEAPPSHGLRQTIWMSATLGSSTNSEVLPAWMKSPERAGRPLALPPHRHTEADLGDAEFTARWTAPKRLELRLDRAVIAKAVAKPARGKRKHTAEKPAQTIEPGWTVQSPDLLASIRGEANGGRLVLVFVNQVKRAHELHDRLRENAAAGPEVLLVHGRMRPHDRQAVISALESTPLATGRVVVATQVLRSRRGSGRRCAFHGALSVAVARAAPWTTESQRQAADGTRGRFRDAKAREGGGLRAPLSRRQG